jgi:hypothetical protein
MSVAWVMVVLCIKSLTCSQGEIWQLDQIYSTKYACYAAAENRTKKGEAVLCLEGKQWQ